MAMNASDVADQIVFAITRPPHVQVKQDTHGLDEVNIEQPEPISRIFAINVFIQLHIFASIFSDQ